MTKPLCFATLPALATCFFAACAGDAPPPSKAPEPLHPVATAIDTSPIPDPVASVPPSCAHGTKPAADGLIDDLEDGNTLVQPLAGRDGSWWMGKADHATISIPSGELQPSEGGAPGSKLGMHFAGKTNPSDSWGATLGVTFLKAGFYDASRYAGIAFKIRSAKPNLDVRLKVLDTNTHPDGGACAKECWNAFGRELILGTEWRDVTLMWSELTQQSDWGDPRPPMVEASKIKDVEWQIWPATEFDIWVNDVRFLACQ